ncbi:Cysteine rich repeat-containing protein [Roseateles sp. YR242]|uniref:cysteine rich repeat-containing protein n=1 Tax=Roseateles sp. YR242 TaxID=1855305 RepID=UPI0008D58BDE|nr:cysteine rich repeat-containing protein [Roseateles sp. YR242]SEL58297.1 Cysteine rich repeat-containing protein [Roseateles sp. YR242]
MNSIPSKKYALMLAVALAWAPWTAQAKEAAASPMASQAAQACRPDFKKLCDGVRPGGGRGLECLKQHESELSTACKTAMGQAKDCAAQARQLCGAEVSEGAEGGDADKRRACLKAHASELSQCKAAK